MKTFCGRMVLVHRIVRKGVSFTPCTYGYATTIRRAQGVTLRCGCIYFDHCYPAPAGYAYVAVSRFRSREGVYYFGRVLHVFLVSLCFRRAVLFCLYAALQVRRSDWIPVGALGEIHDRRGLSSISDSSEESQDFRSEEELVSSDSEVDLGELYSEVRFCFIFGCCR